MNLCDACHSLEKAKDMPEVPNFDESMKYTFDKFMDRTLVQESSRPGIRTVDDSPQRKRAMKNQERPLGRMFIGGGKK